MALDTTGTASAVSLIADPFAGQFAYASQMGVFDTSDGVMNPIDAFPATYAGAGVAIIILNSLPTPLRLVESYIYVDPGAVYTTHGAQTNYPAHTDGVTAAVDAHIIPGARPYPRHAKHLLANKSPALIGGLGVYGFIASSYLRVDGVTGLLDGGTMVIEVARALSFSAAEDGSGPLVAVAVRTITSGDGADNLVTTPYAAVTADLQGGLDDFYAGTMGKSENDDDDDPPNPATNQYDVGPGNDGMTIWATYSNQPSKLGVDCTLTVWVRNTGSTLGLIRS